MKRFLCFALSFVVLFGMTACSSSEPAVEVSRIPEAIAVSDTPSMLAAKDYCTAKGYDLTGCETFTDGAVAVENGKYDYFICDEFSASEIGAFKLKSVEKCEYFSARSICFSSRADDLCKKFNRAISDLNADGTLEKICDSYKGGERYKNKITKGNPLYIVCTDGADGLCEMNGDGEFEGLEIDIVTALCNYLGYSPIFSAELYDEGFALLESGDADAVLSVDSLNFILDDALVLSDYYLVTEYYVYTNEFE